jgi:hypothetical protein
MSDPDIIGTVTDGPTDGPADGPTGPHRADVSPDAGDRPASPARREFKRRIDCSPNGSDRYPGDARCR